MSFEVPQGKERSEYVRRRFTLTAKKYDLFNDIITLGLHRSWKNFLVEKAHLKGGRQALDICCGTGDISQRLSKILGEQGLTVGLDFSEGMLEIAQSRNQGSDIKFIKGDALTLPFRSNSFDAVTVGYGLRNLSDINAGLREVIRVLKPGGLFLCLDMGKIRIPIIKQLFHLYFFHIVPIIGKMIYPGEDLFDYLPKSSVDYPSQEKLAGKLQDIGFEEVKFFLLFLGGNVIHYAEKPHYG